MDSTIAPYNGLYPVNIVQQFVSSSFQACLDLHHFLMGRQINRELVLLTPAGLVQARAVA